MLNSPARRETNPGADSASRRNGEADRNLDQRRAVRPLGRGAPFRPGACLHPGSERTPDHSGFAGRRGLDKSHRQCRNGNRRHRRYPDRNGCRIPGAIPQQAELAVCAAVYLHGMAGDVARERMGEQAMIATDLLHPCRKRCGAPLPGRARSCSAFHRTYKFLACIGIQAFGNLSVVPRGALEQMFERNA